MIQRPDLGTSIKKAKIKPRNRSESYTMRIHILNLQYSGDPNAEQTKTGRSLHPILERSISLEHFKCKKIFYICNGLGKTIQKRLTKFDHTKTGHVLFLDTHCMYMDDLMRITELSDTTSIRRSEFQW